MRMTVSPRWSAVIAGLILSSFTVSIGTAQVTAKGVLPVQSFTTPLPDQAVKNPHVKYDFDLVSEQFAVWTPKDFNEQPGYGVVVFISSDDTWQTLPKGWDTVLKQRKLLYIAPQRAGNDQPVDRRMGLATMAAREMLLNHKLDPKRVYVAGLSGGSRSAGSAAFFEPTLFHGTIQSCGADFYEAVPQVAKRGPHDDVKEPAKYGVFSATADEIEAARQVRFTFITGTFDFRHAQIVDIFHEGYEKAGFNAKLLDVPGMQHEICAGKELSTAIDFIESNTQAKPGTVSTEASGAIPPTVTPTAAPAVALTDLPGPAWGKSDVKKWPQMLGYNDGTLNDGRGIGGSGFLIKLPNTVLAATAIHVFGDGTKVQDVDKLVKSWSLQQPHFPQRKVIIKKLAMTPDPDHPLDCLLANVGASHSALEALVPRYSPPAVGEVLYVMGLTETAKGSQNAFQATVLSRDDDTSEFRYRIEPEIDTNGFSGAPVLDAQGRVVGIHLAHSTTPDGKRCGVGTDIVALLKQANPSVLPGQTPAAATSTTPAKPAQSVTGAGAKPGLKSDKSSAANMSLDIAKRCIAGGKNDRARNILNNVADHFPGTPAADEAKTLLKSIDGK